MPFPFDIAALPDPPFDFRVSSDAGWPLAFADVKRLNAALQTGLERLAQETHGTEAGAVLAIGAPPLLVTFLTVAVACQTAAAAASRNMHFAFGRAGLVQALVNGTPPNVSMFFDQVVARFERARHRDASNLLRRTAHAWIANRGPTLPGSRTIGVFNHNRLLLNNARRRSAHRFRFFTADQLFNGIAEGSIEPALRRTLADIADSLAVLFVDSAGTGDATLHTAMRQAALAWLDTVARQRDGLRHRWHSPPSEMWTGTGGNHMTRLVRARVIESGGTVTGFEHGGGGHIHRDPGAHHLHEFTLCQRFVTDTPAKANAYRQTVVPRRIPGGVVPEFMPGAAGSGSFRWLIGAPARKIRRVMYVTTAFVGELQYPLQPLLPDIIHAVWQGRLIDRLADAGFEVLCKQHPEGLRRGEPLRMSERARYIGSRFAEVRDQADAFVFDYPATTALWEAMCTEKPVLFIDLGLCGWADEPWRLFRQRCAIVTAHYDAGNLPQVEPQTLRSALVAAPTGAPDTDGFAEAYLVGSSRRMESIC